MDKLYPQGHTPLCVYDLNTKFNDKCHADWSKTNLIALVTLEGIYILQPQLELHYGPFQIELIRNPQARFRHQALGENCPRFDKTWHSLDNHQYMEVFLDPALMTNVDTLSMDFYPRRYRFAKWSPPTKIYPRQCLLAVITIDFQLLVFARDRSTWVIKADVSGEYDKLRCQLNKANKQTKSDEENFSNMSHNLHSLSICNVCWEEASNNRLILLSATIPGDIIVWQVTVTPNEAGKHRRNELVLDIGVIIRTNLEYISSMQLFKNLLVASARDGQVVLYDLSVNFKNLDCETSNTAPNQQATANVRTLNLIIVKPTATLWHRDYIEVSDFYLQSITPEIFRIVLAKSTNICWCNITYTKNIDSDSATLAIDDSFSAIDGLDPEVSLHQTPATSLKPAGERRAVLIAGDGSFFLLEFLNNQEDTSPEFNAIRTDKVDLSRMVPRGLCTSPNQILVAMISGISLIYEPTKILAPAKLVLTSLNSDKHYFTDCFQKVTSEEWLRANNIKSPMEVCDHLDYIRSIYPSLNSENFLEYRKILTRIIQEIDHPQNIAQLMKLKIALLLFMKLAKLKPLQSDEARLDMDYYRKCCHKILMYELEEILDALPPETVTNVSSLSQCEINSLRNFHKWLSLVEIQSTTKNRCLDRLSFVRDSEVAREMCPICQSEVLLSSTDLGTCDNQHSFTRCSRSLLVLDLRATGKFSCGHCDRSYMTYKVWPTANSWLCIYCQ